MIVLAGADVVLPDRILPGGSVTIEGDRIAEITAGSTHPPASARVMSLSGTFLLPGFIDVHVHGLAGTDVLDGPGALATVATRMPHHGVTAFCPTSVACAPDALDMLLGAVAAAREAGPRGGARVLPAHLESNFINPDWNGAQPLECLREFNVRRSTIKVGGGAFAGDEIMRVIAAHRRQVAIVTVAPEIAGGMDLVPVLREAGHIVSIGHSGATYAEARAAIAAGVTHATHLFNRMSPFTHREPGVVGAVLESSDAAAEIICDGAHVHPSAVRLALALKGQDRVMAITDGTAGAGLPVGSRTRLGGRPIVVTSRAAELDDGTLAGSTQTMDGAYRMLVQQCGLSPVTAARLCSTTPADRLGLLDHGRIAEGAVADLTVLDRRLQVVQTFIGGVPALEQEAEAHRLFRS
jgi:N-acetylglucosamine-6-phosphate deacetylase